MKTWLLVGILLLIRLIAASTPFHEAARIGNVDMVTDLVENGADVDAKDEKDRTPLHFASRNGHLAVVKFFVIEAKANAEAKDKWDRTPLHLASRNDHLAVVKFLVMEAKANVEARNNYGETPLHWASESGQLAVVKYLMLEAKANVDAKNTWDKTAMDLANCKRKAQVVDFWEQFVVAKGTFLWLNEILLPIYKALSGSSANGIPLFDSDQSFDDVLVVLYPEMKGDRDRLDKLYNEAKDLNNLHALKYESRLKSLLWNQDSCLQYAAFKEFLWVNLPGKLKVSHSDLEQKISQYLKEMHLRIKNAGMVAKQGQETCVFGVCLL
mmetsp:Transcript_10835/g.16142  ORF Transcript_10835/g.16142 Transcript_10835/m.16142 type:complete len:325 (-) Transcript_10835:105-1079(-)